MYKTKRSEAVTEHRRGNKKLHSCETLNVMVTDEALEVMDAKKPYTCSPPRLVKGV